MNGAISFHKDVILMSEKRFKPSDPNVPIPNYLAIIWDSEKCKHMSQDDVVVCLNEQQEKIIELQEIIIDLKDDKNQLHKVISKLRQEVAELKTRNAVLSSRLNEDQIQKCWKSYTTIFGLTMSEKTLIQHFCEYLLNGVWKYDE